MNIFEIQSLIARRRVVTLADIDPNNSYLQVGVFQEGNRKSTASNADTYPPYAIPISALLGTSVTDLKNYLLVDSIYGNDGTAVKNNDLLPYQTIDAAIADAVPFDVIIINPGTYLSFTSIMRPSGAAGTLTFYCHPGVNWNALSPTGPSGCADPGTSLYIYGNGNITFSVRPFGVTGDFNGEIVIECDTLRFAFGGYMILQNTTYLPTALTPENLSINCRVLKFEDVTGIIYTLPWQVNITAERMESTIFGPGGFGISEIWQGGDSQDPLNPLLIKTVINVGKVIKNNPAGCTFMNIIGGAAVNENYINANVDQGPHGAQISTLFRLQGTNSKVYYDGVANLIDAGIVYDQSGLTPFLQVKGKLYHQDTFASLLTTPYYVQTMKLELRNDTISSTVNNPVVDMSVTSQVDLVSAKIVGTDISGLAPALIVKSGGLPCKLRLRDAYLINGGSPSIQAPAPGEPMEVYSAFANAASVNMVNSLGATALIVDAAITDNNL